MGESLAESMSSERTVRDVSGLYTLNLAERVGFEPTSNMEIKEFCGAVWPSKELKGKEGDFLVPPYCP